MAYQNILLGIVTVAFGAMGIMALVAPDRVTAQFDIATLSRAGRNEVRGVYGGFGLLMAAVLAAAALDDGMRSGICIAVAAALAGMAAGRLVGALIDRGIDRWPATYLAIELCGACALMAAR